MNACTLLLFVAAATTAAVGHYLPATTQYHTQDEWGQYAYGYSGGPSAKHEQRTLDGVTRGGYSYVDAHGIVQSVSYVSDPVNGFRAAGTNLPVDKAAAHPAVVHAEPVPIVHAEPVQVVHHVPAFASVRSAYSSAIVHNAEPLPVVHAAPAVPVVHHVPAVSSVRSAYSSAVVHNAEPLPVVHAAPAVPVVHHVPAVSSVRSAYSSAVVHHDAPVPVIVHQPQLLKISKALTPAGTTNLHYPEHHSVLLAASRKKRSVVGPYPGPVVVHHRSFVPVVKPVATSYTSVVRHDPVQVYHAAPAAFVPVAHAYHAAPIPVARHVYAVPATPVVVAPVKTQYHAQDEHGQYAYGYADGESAKSETRYVDGTTVGGYSYVDDRGSVQTVHYTAGADGFTASGTNIPVHHV